MATDKQHVHQLLDQLDAGQFTAIAQLLEVMVDPVARSIASAEVEQEGITPQLAAELDRGRASLDRGEGILHDEIMREFGLTPHS
jgi:hypothetical protein